MGAPDQMIVRPLKLRLSLCLLWSAMAAVWFAVAPAIWAEGENALAVAAGVLGVLSAAGAVRALFLSVTLTADRVTVRSMLWTRSFKWSDIERFATLTIMGEFGEMTSPFLCVGGDGARRKLVVLTAVRPVLFALEATGRSWAPVLEDMERFRVAVVANGHQR